MKKGYSAWLVTWEWVGDHAKVSKPLAEVLDPRMSAKRVREIVEILGQREDSLAEKVAWRLMKQRAPYPAEFQMIGGVPWEGEIVCGHNPYLRARLVDDLRITVSPDGQETATWLDRHSARKIAGKLAHLKRSPARV